ncbi:uncharacterized protein EDB93DRAFT_1254458 [Suillus bovinus]|uniref:uncharacterized protein n=1 Tax=Suillus bovinus TaxID=48563 RepID=UPI001B873406|nr:uncharacterized protein EDB93DRAFT_1254458 [Suillus bovinus]KAG2134567.1 hypothetical protein EDB93DRAFT_1254458 [Suillus bovinus]
MAVLAPQDWHPPRDHTTMDTRPQSTNEQQSNIPIQPYPYPVQQPHGTWTPSPNAQPFYPSYYQPQQQQQQQQQQPHQNPYFDPQANAQLAQWAYQQMMYSQQQQHPRPDYFNPSQLFSPFPSGTPPPHSHHQNYPPPQVQRSVSSDAAQYNGFHPYRRPNNTRPQEQQEWRAQPPYARGEASASTTSVNSSSSHGGASRQRTTSQGQVPSRPRIPTTTTTENTRQRTGSNSSTNNHPHHRTASTSSTNSSSTPRPSLSTPPSRSSPTTTATTPQTASSSHARPVRPSPLSQGTYTAAEKRMSRDDSDLAAILEGTSIGTKTGGIKGRLRRALSLNAAQALQEEEEQPSPGASTAKTTPTTLPDPDAASTATVQTKKKGRAASLFNSRLNASTDNISLSSTMSSASVVIRKIGSIGKLARRNSLAGITSLFKDKNKSSEGTDDNGKKKKKKEKDAKGDLVAPTLSHAVAELDRGDWSSPEMSGLSPAAKLARQHTLKSNAEAAAAAKARVESAQPQPNGTHVPAAWEKNTATRAAESSSRVNEDGTRVLVEEDDQSDDGHAYPTQNFISDGWDDDEVWDEDGEEDLTIRVAGDDDEVVAWATNIRRSIERHRTPAKGILKGADNYSQEVYNGETVANPAIRVRSNSYNSHPAQSSELGPLARIPSPDPDHIDGLHRHPSHSSNAPAGEKERSMFTLSNSSAPALSTIPTTPPTLTHRSATTPAKRLVFANNLSVYDTFSSAVYDRRSEPATWSRLTPALAQRIKEELNSYKMEEMEVHACSRMHTQFFI